MARPPDQRIPRAVQAALYEEKFQKYKDLRSKGMRSRAAGRAVGVSENTTRKWEQRLGTLMMQGEYVRERPLMSPGLEDVLSVPITPAAEYSDEAKLALEDFGYFRRRYFGRIASPWQEQAAYTVRGHLESPNKEYVVVNAPPGGGKSTLFTHDIPTWLACRNRSIRVLIGSRTERQAAQYTARVRRTFMREIPLLADEDEVEKGLVLHAESTLVKDYGRFRPISNDLWRNNEFVIAQANDTLLEEKEPSFAAYGMDSGFLGGRFDLVVWDDLVDKRTTRTTEARESLVNWWESEAETRLEPGGLLILQGQRMAADDLYRYALDLTLGDEDELQKPKYHHVVFKAHYEEQCEANHGLDAPKWPEGCLLDPVRISWRELKAIQANRNERYRVLYQQEDVDPGSVLVPSVWIEGGTDSYGFSFPGCWDVDRSAARLPSGVDLSECVSVATADPSPTKNWAVQWWLIHVPSEQRFLIDLFRGPMEAPEFLDWNVAERKFTGLMEDWQVRSIELGAKIQTWIVEVNAAQRFLLAYDHVRRWQILRGVSLIPHTTSRNKIDPDLGIPILQPHYQFGRVRLPGKSRLHMKPLVDELTRYDLQGNGGKTDDCVMANWFMECHLPSLDTLNVKIPEQWRPSWMGAGSLRSA